MRLNFAHSVDGKEGCVMCDSKLGIFHVRPVEAKVHMVIHEYGTVCMAAGINLA